MTNNIALPTTIAAPFHPPTEGLQHDNIIKPVIPKTKAVSPYKKSDKEEEKRAPHNRVYNNPDEECNSQQDQQSSAKQRRVHFFARRRENNQRKGNHAIAEMTDFQSVIAAIQHKYNRAVTPIPEPSLTLAI